MKLRLFSCTCLAVVSITAVLPGCGSMLNREQEIAIGEEHAPKFMSEAGGPIPDPQIQQYVDTIGRKLLGQLPPEQHRDLPWEFHTLDSAVINAFALPGGKVFITRALLARLQNEGQAAGVLGHEIGHVVAEHIGEQMSRQAGIQAGLGVIGAVSDAQWAEVLLGAGGNLYLLRFGRGQELEADRLGMSYMAGAKYDPSQIIGVMEILEEAGGGRGIEMLSTHPHPESRIEQARDLLKTKYAHTQNNPEYQVAIDRYQASVLSRLASLPPPRHTGK